MTVFASITPVSRARQSTGIHGQPRMIMGKEVDPKYYAALKKFMERLSADRSRALAVAGAGDRDAVGVYNETGRKYDKVLVSAFVDGSPKRPEVMFFVDRDNGDILGPKSDLAPNPKRFYGTVFTAHQWDWSDEPKPLDEAKAGVVAARTYGKTTHYERVG